MTVKAKTMHAAIDEILASFDKETITGLAHILSTMAGSEGAVTVSTTKRGRGKAKAAEVEDDELIDDEEEAKPARGRKPRTSKTKVEKETPARRRRKVEEEVEEEEDDESETEMPELADLSDDSVLDFLDNLPDDLEIPEDIKSASIRENTAAVKEFGHDPAEVAGEGSRAERNSALQYFLASIDATASAVAEFGFDDIAAAYEEVTGEELTVKGRGNTKNKAAAMEYLKVLLDQTEDEDEDED